MLKRKSNDVNSFNPAMNDGIEIGTTTTASAPPRISFWRRRVRKISPFSQPYSNTAFSLNLTAGTYTVEWWSLENRMVTFGSDAVATGGNKSFTAPFSGGAVL